MLSLIFGGRRSGKSGWAERRALSSSRQELIYLATCRPLDAGMNERVRLHQQRRAAHPRAWIVREEPIHLAACLEKTALASADCLVLLDCLSLWLANLMENHNDQEIAAEADKLIAAMQNFNGDILVVSNEVGLGVAPSTEAGNRFIDLAGILNQKIAHVADEVIFIAAGFPLYLKKKE